MREPIEIRARLAQIEGALGEGEFFADDTFSIVDAVFGPVFRYFDVFDAIGEFGFWDGLPKVKRWRRALAKRPSVAEAVRPDYPEAAWQVLVGAPFCAVRAHDTGGRIGVTRRMTVFSVPSMLTQEQAVEIPVMAATVQRNDDDLRARFCGHGSASATTAGSETPHTLCDWSRTKGSAWPARSSRSPSLRPCRRCKACHLRAR